MANQYLNCTIMFVVYGESNIGCFPRTFHGHLLEDQFMGLPIGTMVKESITQSLGIFGEPPYIDRFVILKRRVGYETHQFAVLQNCCCLNISH